MYFDLIFQGVPLSKQSFSRPAVALLLEPLMSVLHLLALLGNVPLPLQATARERHISKQYMREAYLRHMPVYTSFRSISVSRSFAPMLASASASTWTCRT